jgi:hypothetical protein
MRDPHDFRSHRVVRLLVALILCALAQAAQAQVKVTADNSYALFYRDQSGALNFLGTDTCTTAACIYAAETYAAPQPGQDIYLVAWSDHGVAQGLLAEVSVGGTAIHGGDPRWRVYATGVTFNGPPSGAAFQSTLNSRINSSTAANWVAPAIGEDNASASVGVYGPVSGLAGQNRWMWFQSTKRECGGANSPFSPGCNHNEYLIFRLSARDLPQPPCASAGEPASCCLAQTFRRSGVYAFSVVVNNQTGGPATLGITATQGTVNTFTPTTLPPGNTMVTGTFTAPIGANVCLVFEVAGRGGRCRFERCFKQLPRCPEPGPLDLNDGIKVNPDIRVREPERPPAD